MVMRDPELHISAKAIYAYLCTFAGSKKSCYPPRDMICKDLRISKDCFTKHLKQLVSLGYVVVTQEKEKGRFSHNVYTLPDMVLPCPENADTVNAGHGETVPKNNKSKSNTKSKNNIPSKDPESGFNVFWAAYPKKKDKEAARKAWFKLRPDEQLQGVILQAITVQANTADWRKESGRFIPYPATWLNNKRWEDDTGQPTLKEWDPHKNPYEEY